MSPRRTWLKAGAVVWLVIGLGHFVLVDVLALGLRTRAARIEPVGELLDVMERNVIDFGWLGAANLYRASSGFSLWLAVSLWVMGAMMLMVGAQAAVRVKPFALLGAVASVVFTAIAVRGFIPPPMVCGALAAGCFAVSWLRES